MARTFIALELSREAVNEISRIQKLIWKKTLFTGKLTESENLHLTLKFLGEISEEQIAEVKKRLALIKIPEFFAETGEIGVFNKDFPGKKVFPVNPTPKNNAKKEYGFIKIIWMKLNGGGIWNLQKEIDEKLKDLFPAEERFMSHITIARVKNVSDKKGFLEYLESVKPKKIRFLVKEFALKKSELLESGPKYEDIERYNLFGEKI